MNIDRIALWALIGFVMGTLMCMFASRFKQAEKKDKKLDELKEHMKDW